MADARLTAATAAVQAQERLINELRGLPEQDAALIEQGVPARRTNKLLQKSAINPRHALGARSHGRIPYYTASGSAMAARDAGMTVKLLLEGNAPPYPCRFASEGRHNGVLTPTLQAIA